MTLPTRFDLARAICCGAECRNPDHCAATDASRAHLVDIGQATTRVVTLLCERWRTYRDAGPMTRATTLEGNTE